MPRIMIKGGVWRNTEDEILKASIMKYGPNQWSRVASLFHKKSAKQCKARWCEWLDPSIKKTEWSREEEEKLLNLAKLFPCQWRTIAPMVGRTPAQCLEHYEHLLDKAQRKEGETAKDDDLKRNKASELDTCPENKPALPDPQDMDEDEIEMLSEARARLANTQGKKAKRKAREKQLEEARRLSSLQKRQELREAGIEIGRFKRKKKRRAVDYNAEIPFEQKPPPGFYDISNELPPPTGDIPRGSTIQSLEGPTRDELEEKERKKDKEKQLTRKETDLPGLVAQINQLSHSEINSRKRSKLVLPEPQISDGELEEMIKVGHIGQNALDMATDSSNESSNLLLSSYSMSSGPNTPMRTPQVPIEESYVQKEAENLIALTQQQTPLKGGENTILQNTGVTGLLSKSKVIQTPNTVLGTPFRTPGPIQSGTGNGTPGGVSSCTTPSVSGGTTPGSVRDKLHINPEDAISELTDYTAAGQDAYQRLQVKQTLATLPAPRNDFQVVMPEMDTKSTITSLDGGPRLPEGFIEDQADIDQRMEEERLQDLEEMISKQTQVIQRNLPRPLDVNKTILRGKIHSEQRYKELYEAEELIKLEMLKLISYDLVNFPPDNLNKQQKEALSALSDELQINPLEEISPEDIQQSAELLKEEEFVVREAMNHGNLNLDTYSKIWDECYKQVLYLPNQKKYTRASLTGNKEKLDYLENKFANNRACMTKEAKNAVKLEKKVKILLGGYQMRAATLSKRIEDTSDQLEHLYTEYVTFDSLKRQEEMAIPIRLDTLKRLVDAQHDRHSQLQDKYSDLLLERDEFKAALTVNYK